MQRQVIEHWRDGERIAKIKVTAKMIQRASDGTARVTLPPGRVVLATGDELHFDVESIVECLRS